MRRASLALMIMLVGCSLPPASIGTELQQSTLPPTFTEREPERMRLAEAEDLPTIAAGECPAIVSDFPTSYFEDSVLIRLPVGVDEDNFVEYSPGFARLVGKPESTSCHPNTRAPIIEFMALVMFADDPDKQLAMIRAELLAAIGYPIESKAVAHNPGSNPRSGMWVYDIPASPDPAKLLLVLKSAHGMLAAVIYEVHPNAWPVLVDSLVASGDRLLLVPSG